MNRIVERQWNKVFVASACRTPIGRTAGSLSGLSDVRMLALSIREAINRCKLEGIKVDSAYVGCCFPQEPYNLGRKAVLEAGLSDRIPASTINRTCCSSMEALVQGAREIMLGEADIVLIGGVENMSRTPHVMREAINKLRKKTADILPDFDSIQEVKPDDLGICAEITAKKYHISRQAQDEYAYYSYLKAIHAHKNGYFKEEIFPVPIKEDNSEFLDYDENIPLEVDLDQFKTEKPIFLRDGTITKSNATSLNDGAAAMILMSDRAVKEWNINPMAEFIASKAVALPYKEFTLAPKMALEQLFEKVGLTLEQIDLIEYNEAYAAQALLGNPLLLKHMDKVNISGSSLAIGHPVGCTGLRICVTLLHNMIRLQKELGVASLCGGGGMGQSVLFQAV